MVTVIALILLVVPTVAHATTYWVSPSGTATLCTDIDGDTDPGVAIGNVTSSSPAYMTPSAIDTANCAAAGDTIMFKSGVYTGPIVRPDQMIPSGVSPSQRSQLLCEGNQTCQIAYNTEAYTNGGMWTLYNRRNFVIGRLGNGFDVNAINAPGTPAGIRLHLSSSANPQLYSDILIEGNLIRNMGSSGISAHRYSNSHMYTNVVVRYNTIMSWRATTLVPDTPHGIYATGEDWLIEHNEIHTKVGSTGSYPMYAVQGWHYANRTIVRYNHLIINNPDGRGFTNGNSKTNTPTNALFHHNYVECPANNCTALAISLADSADNTSVYNNTVSGFAIFLNVTSGNTGSLFKNNVCTNGACAISINSPATLDCGGTCSTTNPTVTASSHFRDAANGDFSLISGSSLINAGLDVGLSYNGAAPDRGAHETFSPSTATINSNQIDVSIDMNGFSPLQLISGTIGWSVHCTGTGCPTQTVTSASIVSGSSSIVRLTIPGICAIGQTWTWGYDSTSGNVQDQAKVGGLIGQRMFTYTSQPITNNCGGTAASYPAGYQLWYTLNDNSSGTAPEVILDESSNTLDGVLMGGGTWNASGKEGNSITLTPDSGQYAAIRFGNGFNPSSTSLTVAFWVKVTPGRESLNKGYFGSSLGADQRVAITTKDNTWKLSIQGSTDSVANGVSDLSVEPGVWTYLCLVMNSATDTATLYKNGVAGTAAGVVKSYTSYTFASNFELGRIGGIATGGGADFDDLIIYQSVQDCNTLYRVREPLPSSLIGTFTQVAHQFGFIYHSPAGAWQTYGPLNASSVEVIRDGAVSLVTQIDCTSANCSAIGTRYYYSHNGGVFRMVPDAMTSDEIQFWGTSNTTYIFTGAADRLSGSLTETKGQTNLTSNAANFDLPQNGSYTWRGVFKFGPTASGTYCFKSYVQDGSALNGGYSPSGGACVLIVNPMASGVGF